MTDQTTEPLTAEREQEIRDQFATWPKHATIPSLLAAIDDLRAENAKLIRWHREDETALDKMRETIVGLRVELAEATTAAPAAVVGGVSGTNQ